MNEDKPNFNTSTPKDDMNDKETKAVPNTAVVLARIARIIEAKGNYIAAISNFNGMERIEGKLKGKGFWLPIFVPFST